MKKITSILLSLVMIVSMTFVPSVAKSSSINHDGTYLTFDEDTKYDFKEYQKKKNTNNERLSGTLKATGDITTGDKNGFDSYTADQLSFTYSLNKDLLKNNEKKWHLVKDNTKKVDSFKLDNKVGMGTVIVQSSKDEKLLNKSKPRHIISLDDKNNADININNIQLENGTYFRIIVAYKMERTKSTSKVLFVEKKNKEQVRVAEVYKFYVNKEGPEAPNSNQYTIGTLDYTGKKDDGYKEKQDFLPGTPSAIGYFYIKGFEDVDNSDPNEPIFLKNTGNIVEFKFNLDQNLERLNNDEAFSINEDDDGFDAYFNTKKGNVGKGLLVIRKTDSNNEKPTISYENFLASEASTTADTKIRVCEEGDYEFALDYEVKYDKRSVLGQSIVPEYLHYRLNGKFKVRNGDAIAFPIENKTQKQLPTGSITSKGFKIDFANSKYLKVSVKRSLIQNNNGIYTTDTIENEPASDGKVFKKPGLYTITIKNEYSGLTTHKVIYVGDVLPYTSESFKNYSNSNSPNISDLKINKTDPKVSAALINTKTDGAETAKVSKNNTANNRLIVLGVAVAFVLALVIIWIKKK